MGADLRMWGWPSKMSMEPWEEPYSAPFPSRECGQCRSVDNAEAFCD